jgi:hypothetical protein
MRQLVTSYFTTLSPVQKPTLRPVRLLHNALLNIGNKENIVERDLR